MLGEKTKPEQPRRKIPFLKHYVPVWALLLVVLGIASVVAVVVLNYEPIIANVGEPLVLPQSTTTYDTKAGSTETFTLGVQNWANNPITFTLAWSSQQAEFLTITADGQAIAQAGLQFTVPARTSLTEPGSITIAMTATTSTSAPAGEPGLPFQVTIQFTVTR